MVLSYTGCDLTVPWASVQFSCSVVSDSLQPHEPQPAGSPCPSPTFRVYSNSCPLSQWCHPTISSSVVPFSFPQSFPASGSFQMRQLFASSGQSIGISVSTSVLPMNTQDWSPFGWTSWISLQSKGFSRVFFNTVQKHQFFGAQLYSLTLTSIELVMPSSHLILCRPLLLPQIPPSIKVFSNESTLRMR